MIYVEWISNYIERKRARGILHLQGMCSHATAEMAAAFPELKRVPGWASDARGSTEHWWLVTPDGLVVDPTASQFVGEIKYKPFEPGDEVRVGRCMNCGIGIFAKVQDLNDPKYGKSTCSSECEATLAPDFEEELAAIQGAGASRSRRRGGAPG